MLTFHHNITNQTQSLMVSLWHKTQVLISTFKIQKKKKIQKITEKQLGVGMESHFFAFLDQLL